MTDPQFKDICITSFNTDINWFQDLTKLTNRNNNQVIKYSIIQGELCKDGEKKHIQGFIQFIGKQKLSQIKKLLQDNTLHIEARKGTPEQARDYCTQLKNGVWQEYKEFGTLDTTTQGKRTDLIELKDRLKSGETLNQISYDTDDNQLQHLILQYGRGLKDLEYTIKQTQVRNKIAEQYTDTKWNNLQKQILDIVENQKCNRTINWIYDDYGNSGKSYVAKYLLTTKSVYYITGGKQNDILYGYNGEPIIIYDLARTYADNLEHIYTTIELFKNGMYLSTKYETQQRIFNVPTIILLANFKPDQSKLSHDRWNIIDADDYPADIEERLPLTPLIPIKKKDMKK